MILPKVLSSSFSSAFGFSVVVVVVVVVVFLLAIWALVQCGWSLQCGFLQAPLKSIDNDHNFAGIIDDEDQSLQNVTDIADISCEINGKLGKHTVLQNMKVLE